MQVVGETSQQEVWVASRQRKFRINEILVIEDPDLAFPKGEVCETRSYNRYIPLSVDRGLVDAGVLESLRRVGYAIDDEEVNIARLRLLAETPYPVRTGVAVRLPQFAEVKDLLVRGDPGSGPILGVIKSTEELVSQMEERYRGIAPVAEGERLREDAGVPFLFDLRAMQQYPHLGIFGGSGSGKSHAMRVLLEELMRLQVPAVVFDPHFEMDFRQAGPAAPAPGAGLDDRHVVFRIGVDIGVNFSQLSTRDLLDLLGAAAPLSEAMVNAAEMLHKRMDSYQTFSARVNLLAEALEEGRQAIERRLKETGLPPQERSRGEECLGLLQEYGNIPLPSVRGIAWRLKRLYQSGLFHHDIKPVEAVVMAAKVAVIQGPIWLLQVFATYLLGNLYRQRRAYRDAQLRHEGAPFFPPFFVATDEAHNFAPKGYDSPAKWVIREIAQEGRKYGVFLLLATQRPALLEETVTAQLNTKVIFRTVRSSDIQTIREETDLTQEETRRLPYLQSGDAFVSSALFGRTVAVRVRATRTTSPHTENPFDELSRRRELADEEFLAVLAKHLPLRPDRLVHVLPELNRQRKDGRAWELDQVRAKLTELADRGVISRRDTPFGPIYEKPGPVA